MKLRTALCLIMIGLTVFWTCGGTPSQEDKAPEVAYTETPVVCIWDGGYVRADHIKSAKRISGMALGENATWLGPTGLDSNDVDNLYYLVRLSDGTEGWVSRYVLVIDARPAVITEPATVYSRPDFLTQTEVSFEKMDIVALSRSEGDWSEVTGERKRKQGWINSTAVSMEEQDIAVGLLASKALEAPDEVEKTARIQAIVDNPAFASSIFMPDLQAMVAPEEEETEAVAPEGMESTGMDEPTMEEPTMESSDMDATDLESGSEESPSMDE